MQFHYVVGYNTDTKRWFVEGDTTAYFGDGHVWDNDIDAPYGGWTFPEDDTHAAILDQDLLNTLLHIIDVIPTPKVEESNA